MLPHKKPSLKHKLYGNPPIEKPKRKKAKSKKQKSEKTKRSSTSQKKSK